MHSNNNDDSHDDPPAPTRSPQRVQLTYSLGTDGAAGPVHHPLFALLDALELIDISNNIGDSRSLMCHPASTTHYGVGPETRADMGVGEGMLRLNVGLEDPDDLIEDLDQALRKAGL